MIGKSNFLSFVQLHSMEMFRWYGNILEIKLPYCVRGPVFPVVLRVLSELNCSVKRSYSCKFIVAIFAT